MSGRNGVAAESEIRCAIYTRKSTDEGLDQAFNSLDAQRESAEAYIASQKAEGCPLDAGLFVYRRVRGSVRLGERWAVLCALWFGGEPWGARGTRVGRADLSVRSLVGGENFGGG